MVAFCPWCGGELVPGEAETEQLVVVGGFVDVYTLRGLERRIRACSVLACMTCEFVIEPERAARAAPADRPRLQGRQAPPRERELMMEAKPINAVLAGPSYRAHLVPGPGKRLARRPYPKALCGTTPARDSDGWTRCRDRRKVCPRCRLQTARRGGRTPHVAPAKTATPPAKAAKAAKAAPPPKPVVRPDASADAYESRVLSAMERTTKNAELCVQQVGKDMGGGWIVIGTDGTRALLRQGTSETKLPHPLTEREPPTHGIDLTPELEGALRAVWKTTDRKRRTVWLHIDARKRRLTIYPLVGPPAIEMPVTGTLTTRRIGVDLRWLLDGFGRGGRLGYVTAEAKPLVLDTSDGLRYVLMPVAGGR